MKRYLLTCLLALGAAWAQAGVGLTTLPGQQGDGPVTVFYPTAAADQPLQRGAFALQVAVDAAPLPGNGHLVVMSHGSGGAPWVHSDLARKLVEAGFTVAFPEHLGDNYKGMGDAGPVSWRRRPLEVSRAIDSVAQDRRFAAHLALDKVGMYGMSAGGHTALSMAGGRWSPSLMRQHCEQHLEEDFSSCVGLATQLRGNFLDDLRKAVAIRVIRYRLVDSNWYSHTDNRVAAVVAEVPYAVDFDLQSLAHPRVPLGIVRAGQDRWLVPRFHADAVLQACKTCVLVADLPTAGHGSLLSPRPPLQDLGRIAADLLSDPPGFDRAQVPVAQARIVSFFQQKLLP
ncbi:alpha/beta hydrolase family protein [Caenimonas terrae]|uniref:Alpha/beta hydrolase family protein n=1 Tax=Caenimonas terrae TaxID=696074 RepID=A0ABW0NIJ9_9BURK